MGQHQFANIAELQRAQRRNDLKLYHNRTVMRTIPGSIFQMFRNGLPPTWGNIGKISVL